MAEQLLPVAAHLVALVHGDGGPRDVHQALARLDAGEKEALLVVLAGLVDPDQPLGRSLGWLDEVKQSEPMETCLRDLVVDEDLPVDDEFVDEEAVRKFVRGQRVAVTDAEFLAAMQQLVALGYSCVDVDRLHRLQEKTVEKWVNRLRRRAQRSGREFPSLKAGRVFVEAEIVAIRQRFASGTASVVLAVEFDVDDATIRSIVSGHSYSRVGGPISVGRSERSRKASREYMCGHAANSRAATKRHQMGQAA